MKVKKILIIVGIVVVVLIALSIRLVDNNSDGELEDYEKLVIEEKVNVEDNNVSELNASLQSIGLNESFSSFMLIALVIGMVAVMIGVIIPMFTRGVMY